MARNSLNRKKKSGKLAKAPDKWEQWLEFFFPQYVPAPFAPRHIEMWTWFEALVSEIRPRPFVAIWPRGGGKSSTVELGIVRIGARKARRYAWYVSETQDQADKHVDTIGSVLEKNDLFSQYYPDLTSRALGKYGASKGWRRSRLRTKSGFTIDALGLDTAGRGLKVEDQRPDLIVLDDIDDKFDSAVRTLKKLGIISSSILPAGSSDCAVLFVQNLVHPDSIASRLADGRADILSDRVLSGPFKAIDNFTYTQVNNQVTITGGKATWAGQSLEICSGNIGTWGLTAFKQEAQQEVENVGGRWSHIDWIRVPWDKLPKLLKIVVWVDPAVTSTDESDSQGVCAAALGADNIKYLLYGWEGIDSPEQALERAINKAIELGAESVGVETDQGGDTWLSVYKEACENIQRAHAGEHMRFPRFKSDKAGAGYGPKVERNSQMLADYERGHVYHAIGTHGAVERALLRFPIKPLDLADAWWWAWHDLDTNAPTEEELRRYGADQAAPDDIDDDAVAYYADTYGLTMEQARKELLKEREKVK